MNIIAKSHIFCNEVLGCQKCRLQTVLGATNKGGNWSTQIFDINCFGYIEDLTLAKTHKKLKPSLYVKRSMSISCMKNDAMLWHYWPITIFSVQALEQTCMQQLHSVIQHCDI